MVPSPPQTEVHEVVLVELVLDDDDPPECITLQVTEHVRLRLPSTIDPGLAAAIVEVICRC